MKPIIADLKDSYKISSDVFRNSQVEAKEVIDMYHNRQYTAEEISVLQGRGQPVETYNVVKMLTHAMLGYLDTVANDIQVFPSHPSSNVSALVLNDSVDHTLYHNDFDDVEMELKQDLMHSGLSVCYENVVPTGATDEFGRKVYEIELTRVPPWQIRIDPMSRLEDYSDARYIHRTLWIDEDEFKLRWPNRIQELNANEDNFLEGEQDADFEREFGKKFVGKYRYWHNYLIVHSIVKDTSTGKYWSVIWSDEVILEKKEITYLNVKFPYRVTKAFKSDVAEYYGMFREVIEPQKAINQAVIQIQMLVNTNKAFVEKNAVDDIEEFRETFNRVNQVVEVADLAGIKIEDMSRDVQAQYLILDNALTRIKSVMGINDSFLGQAFASDSGRKVQMQKQSASSQLTPIVKSVTAMLRNIGKDIVALQQQYFTATQLIRVADPINGDRYTQLNKPLMQPTGMTDNFGQPIQVPIFAEEIDPETGEAMEDSNGNIIVTPLNDPDTDIKFSQADIRVQAVPYNNAEERNQLLFETFLQGPVGQYVGQMDPASYLQVASLQISEYGSKHSAQISEILQQLAMKISGGQVDPTLAMTGGDTQAVMGGALGGATNNPKSQSLQIPTKFNEGQNNA